MATFMKMLICKGGASMLDAENNSTCLVAAMLSEESKMKLGISLYRLYNNAVSQAMKFYLTERCLREYVFQIVKSRK